MDPIERQRFQALVRGMLPAPFVYVVVAVIYFAIVDSEPFFGARLAIIVAVVTGITVPIASLLVTANAMATERPPARLAQTLLLFAHTPGIVGFVLTVGADQLWYSLALGAEGFAILLVIRARFGR
ncbi:MAG: hypothetical protein OXL97_12535 [Chloroflexota bacterium]|nr:hypothetical protein [Chloroflexota bacterium]MDE2883750.1 hypothetical protein [Chloroflexota bacterium]